MTEITCPGLPASWINGWLASVGTTVLDPRIRLRWTEGNPVAVLSAEDLDPVAALVESWPSKALLERLPIAEEWNGAGTLRRKVPVDDFGARAEAIRGDPHAWTLSSTMTDLSVDEAGEVMHAPFDPAGTGPMKWLHHRLLKVWAKVEPSEERIRLSLKGQSGRVRDSGLGFDQARVGSLADDTNVLVDPAVEILAFFGLAILPVRGTGRDARVHRQSDLGLRQRGWRKMPSTAARSFCWPAWGQSLDCDAIDALLDAWRPGVRRAWTRLGVHAGWRTVGYHARSSSDPTRAFGSERL